MASSSSEDSAAKQVIQCEIHEATQIWPLPSNALIQPWLQTVGPLLEAMEFFSALFQFDINMGLALHAYATWEAPKTRFYFLYQGTTYKVKINANSMVTIGIMSGDRQPISHSHAKTLIKPFVTQTTPKNLIHTNNGYLIDAITEPVIQTIAHLLSNFLVISTVCKDRIQSKLLNQIVTFFLEFPGPSVVPYYWHSFLIRELTISIKPNNCDRIAVGPLLCNFVCALLETKVCGFHRSSLLSSTMPHTNL
ncbi:hypothetical protein O6H91_Y505400 [Diphasiastrum complanatum]|nr:hypothetical protein O6H91_Y505400 [Diphasiastrum complanatum]